MSLASTPLTVVIVVIGALLALLLVAAYFSGRRRSGAPAAGSEPGQPGWVGGLSASPASSGEQIASHAAETIEALAQARIEKHPDLAGLRLDFGTASSGELEIWVGSERYESVDAIPDDRIRQAISEAVAAFNRGADGGEAA